VTTTNSLDIHKASSLVDDAEHGLCLFSPPGFKKAEGGLCVLLLFYLKNIFSDFCHTSYLNIYPTDLYEICMDGRTLAVDA